MASHAPEGSGMYPTPLQIDSADPRSYYETAKRIALLAPGLGIGRVGIVANNGMEPSDASVFFKKYGFYVKLSLVDDPVKARDLFASGQSHILWGTLDMMALFAPELVKDS